LREAVLAFSRNRVACYRTRALANREAAEALAVSVFVANEPIVAVALFRARPSNVDARLQLRYAARAGCGWAGAKIKLRRVVIKELPKLLASLLDRAAPIAPLRAAGSAIVGVSATENRLAKINASRTAIGVKSQHGVGPSVTTARASAVAVLAHYRVAAVYPNAVSTDPHGVIEFAVGCATRSAIVDLARLPILVIGIGVWVCAVIPAALHADFITVAGAIGTTAVLTSC
jgi:hypothetical protein